MKIYVVGSSKNKFRTLNDIRQKFIIDDKHNGDNIDHLNPCMCELTGLYYLWKHTDDEVIGLEHYRRYFADKNRNLLSKDEINTILQNADIITIRHACKGPCKNWLIDNGKWNDVQKFLTFSKLYVGEEYYDACTSCLDMNYHCLGNMFIGKRETANKYCSFIFDLLENYILAELHINRKIPKRICGYFTEFLFNAWLEWKHKKQAFGNLLFGT